MSVVHTAREFLKEAATMRTTVSYEDLANYCQAQVFLSHIAKADQALGTPPLVSLIMEEGAPMEGVMEFILGNCKVSILLRDQPPRKILAHYQGMCINYYDPRYNFDRTYQFYK